MKSAGNVTLFDTRNAAGVVLNLGATFASPWVDCRGCKSVRFHWVSDNTSTPVGALTFEGSEDPEASDEIAVTPQTLPSATRVDRVVLTIPTGAIHGTGLTVNAVNATLVDLADPPSFIRLVYTRGSGGATAGARCYVGRRET